MWGAVMLDAARKSACISMAVFVKTVLGSHVGVFGAPHILEPTVDGRNPAPPKKPWKDDSPVNTNKQWFQPRIPSGANWFRNHPQYVSGWIG